MYFRLHLRDNKVSTNTMNIGAADYLLQDSQRSIYMTRQYQLYCSHAAADGDLAKYVSIMTSVALRARGEKSAKTTKRKI